MLVFSLSTSTPVNYCLARLLQRYFSTAYLFLLPLAWWFPVHVAAVCIFMLCASTVSYQNWDANLCGGYPILSPINQCLCGRFSLPRILVTTPAWEGLQLKGWELQLRTEAFLRHEVRTSALPFCWQSYAWGPGTLRYVCGFPPSLVEEHVTAAKSAAFWKTSTHQPFFGGRREVDVSAWSQRGEWCEHVPVPARCNVMNDCSPTTEYPR